MANSKIDSISIGGTVYDIDLPTDATPTISTLSLNNLYVTKGGTISYGVDETTTGGSNPFVIQGNNYEGLTFSGFTALNYKSSQKGIYLTYDFDSTANFPYLALSTSSTISTPINGGNYYGANRLNIDTIWGSTVSVTTVSASTISASTVNATTVGGTTVLAGTLSTYPLGTSSIKVTTSLTVSGRVYASTLQGGSLSIDSISNYTSGSVISINASTSFNARIYATSSINTTDSIYAATTILAGRSVNARQSLNIDDVDGDKDKYIRLLDSSADPTYPVGPFLFTPAYESYSSSTTSYYGGDNAIFVGYQDSAGESVGPTSLKYNTITTSQYYINSGTTSTTSYRAMVWKYKGSSLATSAITSLLTYATNSTTFSYPVAPSSTTSTGVAFLLIPTGANTYFYASSTVGSTTSIKGPLMVHRYGTSSFYYTYWSGTTTVSRSISYVGRCMVFELL